jgi:hypothetical protein
MARHCVRWAPGKKRHGKKRYRHHGRFRYRVRSRRGKKCRFGVVKRGRRRGQCLKHKRPKGRWHMVGRSGAKSYYR